MNKPKHKRFLKYPVVIAAIGGVVALTVTLITLAVKMDRARTAGSEKRIGEDVVATFTGGEVTATRLYLEAMEKVLPGVKKFLVASGIEIGGTDLWFFGEDINPVLETK